jgi:hypothetical protein
MTEPLDMGDEGPVRRHADLAALGEKTELRASDISKTSVLVSRTVQELHFPCLHFEVKAAAKNGEACGV